MYPKEGYFCEKKIEIFVPFFKNLTENYCSAVYRLTKVVIRQVL